MRAAIVGSGFIAEVHAKALRGLGHSLAAVVSANAAHAAAFAKTWRAERWGTDPALALADDIDCVHICTPPALHFDMARKALLAGKHVVCEKPLTIDPEEAGELARIAEDKGLVAAVDFNVRFHSACGQAKRLVADPSFGKVRLIHGSYLQEFHALPESYGWRYQPELAGPMRATTEIGSHWIDLVRYVTGLEVSAVCASFGAFSPDRYLFGGMMYSEAREGSSPLRVESEDAATVSFRFSNGAMGNVVLSEVSHGRSNRLEIEVCGARASVFWNSEDPYRLSSARKGEGVVASVGAFGGGFPDTFASFFEKVYGDLVTGKASANPPYPTFRDGWRNAAVCSAIARSAAENSAWTEVRYGDGK
jgi:predicted dehydrogenase